MESTGEKNRIQVSQATADLLVASGKGQWIEPREGLVSAKGKGSMQTYWVKFSSGSTSVSDQNVEMAKPVEMSGTESRSDREEAPQSN